MRAPLIIGLTVTAFSLSACAGIRSSSGYVYDEEFAQSIQPGVDNRDSVRATLGEPTFVGQWTDQDWYYVSRKDSRFAFRQPRMTDTKVIHVRFDPAGNVASVENSGPEKVVSIDPADAETPTLGRQRSFFEELFGNIGSVGQPGLPGGGQQPPQQ
jgi:outer membrane protein assembly factor BamE (lipoprotein component of BamABCDE complex)